MRQPSFYSLKRTPGFTLIEILVVLFIISIVTSVALLSISRSNHKHIESFANDMVQIITLAQERAILQPSVLGLSVHERSFHFVTLKANAESKKPIWTPVQIKTLSKHPIPNDIEMRVEMGEQNETAADEKPDPQIIISTNGDTTPFTIYIGKKGKKPSYVIVGHEDGSVTNKALS